VKPTQIFIWFLLEMYNKIFWKRYVRVQNTKDGKYEIDIDSDHKLLQRCNIITNQFKNVILYYYMRLSGPKIDQSSLLLHLKNMSRQACLQFNYLKHFNLRQNPVRHTTYQVCISTLHWNPNLMHFVHGRLSIR
jgi:hypothetical protein